MRANHAIVQEVPGDLTTPVAAFLRLRPLGARFLLESVEGGERSSRYSFVGIGSGKQVWADQSGTWCSSAGSIRQLASAEVDPLNAAIDFALRFNHEPDPRIPHLLGGLVGYISYDYVRRLERLGHPPAGDATPTMEFDLVGELLVFDHLQHRLYIAILPDHLEHNAGDEVERLMEALGGSTPGPVMHVDRLQFQPLTSDDEYCGSVARLQHHIREGDIFQAVLSREVEVHNPPEMFEVYRALRRINPSPYMFFLDFGQVCLAGSSPESAVRLTKGTASLRPIAGTRPRGKDDDEDKALERELRESPKERAEHAMLVDLARNDLSRVAAPGTVRVSKLARVERFSHVMHLVSDVEAMLDAECSCADLIRATFPAGTVSGAPKIRAMQLIDEMETTRRNLYAGCMGYIGSDGTLDLALTIRSAMRVGKRTSIRAGAGVVAGSTPEGELQECQSKLGALMAAFQEASARNQAMENVATDATPENLGEPLARALT